MIGTDVFDFNDEPSITGAIQELKPLSEKTNLLSAPSTASYGCGTREKIKEQPEEDEVIKVKEEETTQEIVLESAACHSPGLQQPTDTYSMAGPTTPFSMSPCGTSTPINAGKENIRESLDLDGLFQILQDSTAMRHRHSGLCVFEQEDLAEPRSFTEFEDSFLTDEEDDLTLYWGLDTPY